MAETNGGHISSGRSFEFCSNECDHDCAIVIHNEYWAGSILRAGWTIVSWQTDPGGAPHDLHRMVFCDPGCLYQHFRARMLADPHWQERLAELDQGAWDRARDLLKREVAEEPPDQES